MLPLELSSLQASFMLTPRVSFVQTAYHRLIFFSHTDFSYCVERKSIICLGAMVACGVVATPVFVAGVGFLGSSSFEFDAIQGNG